MKMTVRFLKQNEIFLPTISFYYNKDFRVGSVWLYFFKYRFAIVFRLNN